MENFSDHLILILHFQGTERELKLKWRGQVKKKIFRLI